MKTYSTFCILYSPIALLAAFALFSTAPRAPAQGDSVTVSAAEFQRMVYASHLLTQMDEKPELDASLQVLLELQRRNPQADPAALAGFLQEATARYRTNAPAYLRTRAFRDEVLAEYLEALRQVPARTNFIPANLSLLNYFMLKPADYARASAAELIHSGNERLLTAEETIAQREELVEACTQRGWGNPAFGAAMDALMWPEIGVVLAHTPAQILSVNSALSNTPTMQEMLYRSSQSGDGSVTLSTNELKNLFAQEMGTMHEIINTNLAVHLAILETQTDLPSYLTNTALIEANLQWENAVKQGQPQRLAAASASVNHVSRMTASKLPNLGQAMGGLGKGVKSFAEGFKSLSEAGKLMKTAACGNFVAGGLQIVGAILNIAGIFQDPNDEILQEIEEVKELINDLSENMNHRFDRVDKSLNQLGEDLDEVLDQLAYSINLIGEVGHDVDEVRRDLVDVQTDLHQLERHLISYVNQLYDRGLNLDFNYFLGYESTYGTSMSQVDYNATEAHFFTHARNNSVDGLSAPYLDRDYTPEGLYWELTESGNGTTNRLDQNLRYIKKYLNDVLAQPTATDLANLANPRDWSVGAYAYAQLALENPECFRDVNISNRLDLITARGRDVTNFLRSLTFTGTNINWSLWNALQDHYLGELTEFSSQVRTTEQQYADALGFAVDHWRDWSAGVQRMSLSGTRVLASPAALRSPTPRDVVNIAGGGYHSLALKDDGTVIAWGRPDDGRLDVPRAATNTLQIAAGMHHSLALQSNGVVVAWGANDYGQTNVAASATNVIAVSAGHYHSLALGADGHVVAWGAGTDDSTWPHHGQSMVPADATNIMAIAAGGYHSLALRNDGTLLAWGLNNGGQTDIPPEATNVAAIAAGHGHNLVLKGDGTLVAWGANTYGTTNIPPEATNIVSIASAGWHCLALRADGEVLSWGWNLEGQTSLPLNLANVDKLAAGLHHSMALKGDGTVLSWGWNDDRQCLVPPQLTWEGALSAGWAHFLSLEPDKTVIDQQLEEDYSPASGLSNAVAIAAGGFHGLILQVDGTVIG